MSTPVVAVRRRPAATVFLGIVTVAVLAMGVVGVAAAFTSQQAVSGGIGAVVAFAVAGGVVWMWGVTPSRITMDSDGDLVFQSPFREVRAPVNEIYAVESPQKSRLYVRWGMGRSIYLVDWFPQLSDLLQAAYRDNSKIEFKGRAESYLRSRSG
jgi:hypothetical protein